MGYLNAEQVAGLLEIIQNTLPDDRERQTYIEGLVLDAVQLPQVAENRKLCNDEFMDAYRDYRAKGMEHSECALLLGISRQRLDGLLRGIGLTAEQHEALLLADLGADLQLRNQLIDQLIAKAESGSEKAIVTLLEKLWPDKYGAAMHVTGNVDMRMTPEEMEQRSKRALEDLRRLRARDA